MDILPDHLLVSVFALLDTPSLLRARGVCRRWRDLALNRSAWRHRGLSLLNLSRNVSRDDEPRRWEWLRSEERCIGPVLRLAPCLLNIDLNRATVRLLPTRDVRCAVSSVWILSVDAADLRHTLSAVQGLLRCGLKALHLRNFHGDLPNLRLVLRLVRNTSLTELGLLVKDVPSTRGGALALRGRNESTLKQLEFALFPRPGELLGPDRCTWPTGIHALEYLLQTHSTTLTSVALRYVPANLPMGALTACANLRELECVPLEGMDALLQCSRLESLHFIIAMNGHLNLAQVHAAVRRFFAGAATLQRLTFSSGAARYGAVAPNVCTDLLWLLSATQRSRLTTLTVRNDDTSNQTVNYLQLSALLHTLPQLARLELLSLGPDALWWAQLAPLFTAISSTATPQLRLLTLGSLLLCPRVGAQHSTGLHSTGLHVETIRALMHANPGLHVADLIVCDECERNACCRKLRCATCWVDGNPLPPSTDAWQRLGLFSHDAQQACDFHDSKGWMRWVRLDPSSQS